MLEYDMGVEISGYDVSNTEAIKDAIANEWEFDAGAWGFHFFGMGILSVQQFPSAIGSTLTDFSSS